MVTNRFISHIIPCLLDEHCNIAAPIAATAESWPIGLLIKLCFVPPLKHTVLNQCSKARMDPDTIAALLGMLSKYLPDREASLIKKEYCRCGPHPLQVTSSRARPPLVKGAGCIGPLFTEFRGWPLWFMASIALRGLQTPCTGGCSWRLIAL